MSEHMQPDAAPQFAPDEDAVVASREQSGGEDALGVERRELLFGGNDDDRYRARWHDIQAEFVDHPRESVERADELVADVMHTLTQAFAAERGRLESQWDQGDDVDTEDLRVALTRYRSFFERLVNA
jgi:hypothetical protein